MTCTSSSTSNHALTYMKSGHVSIPMYTFVLGVIDCMSAQAQSAGRMCICCCATYLHSLCMPCAASAHRVVVGCGIMAACVPHRCLDDPWNPLISQLQAPEAASCTDINPLPHSLAGSTDKVHHMAVAMNCCPSPNASGRLLHQVDRAGLRIVQTHVQKKRHVRFLRHLQK